jgi:hypothetical protein
MTRTEIISLISSTTWYHGWEILPGIETPGQFKLDPSGQLSAIGVPADLTGLSAIDIGTYDGPLAFELEKRGAKVVAADIQDPDRTGFSVARSILGSSVEYVQSSVYDLPKVVGKFDLILFCGVYYHLKHPILAFEEIGKIAYDHTQLFIEGECLVDYAETIDGRPVRMTDFAPDVPICLSYPGRYKGVPNWFVPNVACLKGWLACAGFTLVTHRILAENQQRVIGVALKSENPMAYMADREGNVLVEHPLL